MSNPNDMFTRSDRCNLLKEIISIDDSVIYKIEKYNSLKIEEKIEITIKIIDIKKIIDSYEFKISHILYKWANFIELCEEINYEEENIEIIRNFIFDIANPQLLDENQDEIIHKYKLMVR